jgi:hypothetical protein
MFFVAASARKERPSCWRNTFTDRCIVRTPTSAPTESRRQPRRQSRALGSRARAST